MFKENIEKQNQEPKTTLLKGSDAPKDAKENPFYNVYHWGMADWEEHELYLPESSVAMSFAVASHELGYLVNKDRIQPDRHNFELTRKEEVRAWKEGWKYLEPYLTEYFADNLELIKCIEKIKKEVERIMMEIVELTKSFYQKIDKNKLEQQKDFSQIEEGKLVKVKIDGLENKVNKFIESLNKPELSNKIDWDKFSLVIKKVLLDIEMDNGQEEK